MYQLLHLVGRTIAAFGRNDRGNLAVIFSLALLPLFMFIGAAVDYSMATRARTSMQNALDSAALLVARDVALNALGSDQVNAKTQAIFAGMFNSPEVQDVAVSASYTSGSSPNLVVAGSGSIRTNFLRVVGISSFPVSGNSTITWGNARLRVALVLDNTGSMASAGKMTALQTATKNLLDQLKSNAASNGDVYVSIIPFAKDVNVGTTNRNASWIDWTEWDNANGTCSSWSWGRSYSRSTCSGTWTPANRANWNGCVMDRGEASAPSAGNYDTNATAPTTAIRATLYSAEQYGSCPEAALGLTYDWSALKTLVNAMSPDGNTNQGIGLQLGWMSLVGGGPFTVPPMAPDYTYRQIIILLTDGLNTQNRWFDDQASIDARQQMTCNNVKASGITIYTVQVNTGGDPTSTLLQNCASGPNNFFLLKSANEIVTAFDTIGTQLAKMRISK